jgi:hypothetical protein
MMKRLWRIMGKIEYVKYQDCHKVLNGIEQKRCKDCKAWFVMNKDNFREQSSRKDGFCDRCNTCQAKYNHEYYMKTRDKQISSSKKWRLEHPEKVEEYWRRQNNNGDIDRILYKRHLAKLSREKGCVKRWCQENPDRVKFYFEKRQHKNHKLNKSEWINCKKYFDNKCAYCGLSLSEHYFTRNGVTKLGDFHKEHVDHEGQDDLSNCVSSCGSCNNKKWKFPLEMWYNKQNIIYSQERYDKIIQWITTDYKQFIEEYVPKRKNKKTS